MAFITTLRIKNFFSIKDEISIDFRATPYNIENNPQRVFKHNGEYYNKIIAFYGANASGKSTILKAIIELINIVRNEQRDNFSPSFKNKFAHLNSKSEIEMGFVIGKREFLYKIRFKSNKYRNIGLEDEILYELNNDKKITIFDRKNRVAENINKKIKEVLFDTIDDTKSIFRDFSKFDNSKTLLDIDNFFSRLINSNIEVYKSKLNTDSLDEEYISQVLEDIKLKVELEEFFVKFFKSIGIDIDRVEARFRYEEAKEREFLGLYISHTVDSSEPLEFELESDGTQMLMKILLDIFLAKILNSILIVDEFDSILHPMLIPIINNLLIENSIQIIYSTHNIYNMKFLQNDEIFLIEKDKNHNTTMKPIKNNDVKGYQNLLTLYENSHLGGLPKVEDIITKII